MLDSFLDGLDGAVENGAIGAQAHVVGRAVHVQPFLRVALVWADALAHAGREDLGSAAGQRVEPSRAKALQDLAHLQPEELVEVEDLDCAEGLDVERGLQAFEAGQKLGVVVERQTFVQPAHHVDLGHAIASVEARLQLVPCLCHAQHVGAGLVEAAARERAQFATRHAQVGRVDMQVAVEGCASAVESFAHLIGQGTQLQQIGLAEKCKPVVKRQWNPGVQLF